MKIVNLTKNNKIGIRDVSLTTVISTDVIGKYSFRKFRVENNSELYKCAITQ